MNKLLAHNVFFSLRDASDAARTRLVAASEKWLAPHRGIVFFSCGTLAEDLNRDVNDRDFEVSLHIVFADKEAHDRYQESADHERFIAENRQNWRQVRVFDSIVTTSPAVIGKK
jgi:hypothetical protein